MSDYSPAVFSLHGRIGRVRYLAYSMLYTLIAMVMVVGTAMLMGESSYGIQYAVLTFGALTAACFVPVIRRLNDLDKSGWLSILLFVPIINLLLYIYVTFFPGTDGENGYGDPPEPNSVGVIICALVIPLLLLGSIGAIFLAVGGPAYQEYMNEAEKMSGEAWQDGDATLEEFTMEDVENTARELAELEAQLKALEAEAVNMSQQIEAAEPESRPVPEPVREIRTPSSSFAIPDKPIPSLLTMSGDALQRNCNGNNTERSACDAFVARLTKNWLQEHPDCVLQDSDTTRLVNNYLMRNPDQLGESASTILDNVLSKNADCR